MKKLLALLCLVSMLVAVFTACDTGVNGKIKTNDNVETKEQTENEEETAKSEQYIAMYDIVLENLYELIGSSETDHLPSYMISISEVTDEDPYEFFGYSYRDLNGDDIPELLITAEDSSNLYAVYTIKKDNPVLILESPGAGYANVHIHELLKNGKIYYFQGGNWPIAGLYNVSKDGEFVCEEYFFIGVDPDSGKGDVYRNSTGKEDIENSEKVTMEDMDSFTEECISNFATVESTPLGEFK